jgi:hypothetical protein
VEHLIVEPPDPNGNSFCAGPIRIGESALPKPGLTRCADIDDELLGARVIGERCFHDRKIAPLAVPATEDGGHLRVRLKDVNPVRSQMIEEHGDMPALLAAHIYDVGFRLDQRRVADHEKALPMDKRAAHAARFERQKHLFGAGGVSHDVNRPGFVGGHFV